MKVCAFFDWYFGFQSSNRSFLTAEQRKMQRKISELEEELVQMETVKEDNSRLKNENGALVRVISKLSERV